MKKNELKEKIVEKILNNEWEEHMFPLRKTLMYYKSAIVEVESKFKVLDMQFSINYDRNPIESIKSRLKSTEGIIRKLKKKEYPLTLESIEENIWDVAGIRVICSFQDDIYFLSESLLR